MQLGRCIIEKRGVIYGIILKIFVAKIVSNLLHFIFAVSTGRKYVLRVVYFSVT